MVFGTILTSGQQVPTDSGSSATGTAILNFNEAGNALNYELTVFGLDFGAFVGDGTPQTSDTFDDVTGIDFANAPPGQSGDIVFSAVGINQDDDLIFTSNPDGSTTISGSWEETDLANIPLSSFLPSLNSAVATTNANGTRQVSDLYLNISTVGNPQGAIRGQIVSIPPDDANLLSMVDPIALNGLIEQGGITMI